VKYALNRDTILLYPKISESGVKTIVYEVNQIYEIDETPKNIIRENCLEYGSTLEGRKEHSRVLTNSRSKLPIIVKEDEKMIIFPIKSMRKCSCGWVNSRNRKYLNALKDGKFLVKSYHDDIVDLNVSKEVLDNQVLRSAFLYWRYFK